MKTLVPTLVLITIFLCSCAKFNEPYAREKLLEIDHIYYTTGYARDIDVSDSLIYIAEDQGGVSIYNHITNIQLCHIDSIPEIASIIENARLISVAEDDSLLFVYDRYGSPPSIDFFNISDLSNPFFVFRISSSTGSVGGMRSILNKNGSTDFFWTNGNEYIFGNYIYPILWIDPQTFSFPNSVSGFDWDSTYIYLAGEQRGLYIADRNSGNIISETDTPGEALAVKVVDNYVYIANKYTGLQVIDISDKENPALIFNYDTNGWAQSVDVERDYLVVGSGGGGVYLFDITDLSRPKFLDRLDDDKIGYTYKAVLSNGEIFVASRMGVVKLKIKDY